MTQPLSPREKVETLIMSAFVALVMAGILLGGCLWLFVYVLGNELPQYQGG